MVLILCLKLLLIVLSFKVTLVRKVCKQILDTQSLKTVWGLPSSKNSYIGTQQALAKASDRSASSAWCAVQHRPQHLVTLKWALAQWFRFTLRLSSLQIVVSFEHFPLQISTNSLQESLNEMLLTRFQKHQSWSRQELVPPQLNLNWHSGFHCCSRETHFSAWRVIPRLVCVKASLCVHVCRTVPVWACCWHWSEFSKLLLMDGCF